MALPSTGVLVRLYDDSEFLRDALKSIYEQDYPGPITAHVALDRGDPSDTPVVAHRTIANLSRPGLRWNVHSFPHTTPARSLVLLMRQSSEDQVFMLDGDNTMDTDRISAHLAVHPDPPGFCLCQTRYITLDDQNIATQTNNDDLRLPRLLEASDMLQSESETTDGLLTSHNLALHNEIDTGQIRIAGAYLRSRLNPMFRLVDIDDCIEDWLFGMIGAMDNRIDAHPLVLTTHIERTDSYDRTTGHRMKARHVSTRAVFANVRRQIAMGRLPPPSSYSILPHR